MRRQWDHAAPAATQPEPADNTTEYVLEQVAVWELMGQPVHPEIALEIAGWWQGPRGHGARLAEFTGRGTLSAALEDAVRAERAAVVETGGPSALENYRVLSALLAYIAAASGGPRSGR